MTAQLRETQFGHLVRFVTNKKLLRFPDEDDPSLWRASLGPSPAGTDSGKGETGTPAEHNSSTPNAALQDYEAQDPSPNRPGMQQTVESTYDHIIGWYSPDDPEVSRSIKLSAVYVLNAHHTCRTLKIGPANGNCWSVSKSAFSTFHSTSQALFILQASRVSWKNLM